MVAQGHAKFNSLIPTQKGYFNFMCVLGLNLRQACKDYFLKSNPLQFQLLL